MDYRPLGSTGLEVSEVGFGCGSTGGLFVRGDAAEQRAAVEVAVGGGITYFDTAAQYGDGRSEENLGRVLRELRVDAVVGTKINLSPEEVDGSETAVVAKLRQGLGRLGRERVEACALHGRVGLRSDPPGRVLAVDDVCGPIAAGMHRAVEAGLTGAIGFTGLGDTAAVRRVVSSGRFDYLQCYFNLLNPSAARPGTAPPGTQDFDGVMGHAAQAGMGVVVIRVFGAGAIGASPQRHPVAGTPGATLAVGGDYESDRARAQRLVGVAAELGLESPFELALRTALGQQQASTVLVGFSDRGQVEAALRWQARGAMSDNEVARQIGEAR